MDSDEINIEKNKKTKSFIFLKKKTLKIFRSSIKGLPYFKLE
tara:strand:- start:625 stop:750 length:126 start_codon:yes stop_codon:yes gene_type:complete